MAEEQKKKKKRATALKRDIQNEKKRLVNKAFKSRVRTAMNALESAIQSNEKDQVSAQLSQVYGLMDKGVKRGIYKLNKASRTKSRLTKKVAL